MGCQADCCKELKELDEIVDLVLCLHSAHACLVPALPLWKDPLLRPRLTLIHYEATQE
jgi:hypothetical protein